MDRNVTVKGQTSGEEYDLNFKKGWNVMYYLWKENGANPDDTAEIITSKKPSGIDYAWHFYGDYDYMSAPAAKSASSQKSFISKFKVNKIRE